jgi:putative ATP-binding cassette transporter
MPVAGYAGGVSSHDGAVVKPFAFLADMKILVLFRKELATGWKRFFLLAALSGAANAAVLAAINNAAAHLHEAETRGQAFLVVVIGVLVFVLAQRALLMMAANLAEGAVYRLRVDLLERIRSAELPEIEALNRNQIYSAVNADMQVIAGGAPALMVIGQSALLVVMTLIYVALLSVWAFVLAVVLIVVAVALHLARSRQMQERFAEASVAEMQVMDGFTDLIEGFKEVKLSTARSDELAASVRKLSESVMKSRLAARALFATDSVISQAMFFLLTALMVFVVPLFTDLDQETLIKITTTSLFLMGPLTGAVSGIPVLQRVNAAAASILAVESQLSEMGRGTVEGFQNLPPFERIAMQGVTYQYPAQDKEAGFSVGPIDLEIRRGEVVFITGGNGSGKSTLLKLLTGLYLPSSGIMMLNNTPIGPENMIAYRNLIAAVFSDNHLFRKLYGMPQIDPAASHMLFHLLEMEGKTSIVDRAFGKITLSGGQRKRLALIALLLEDRPIYVFDEWAADQDPHFREKFYRDILPRIQAAGRTVIAVTHDEKYFDVPELRVRRVHMEEGRIASVVERDH